MFKILLNISYEVIKKVYNILQKKTLRKIIIEFISYAIENQGLEYSCGTIIGQVYSSRTCKMISQDDR